MSTAEKVSHKGRAFPNHFRDQKVLRAPHMQIHLAVLAIVFLSTAASSNGFLRPCSAAFPLKKKNVMWSEPSRTNYQLAMGQKDANPLGKTTGFKVRSMFLLPKDFYPTISGNLTIVTQSSSLPHLWKHLRC